VPALPWIVLVVAVLIALLLLFLVAPPLGVALAVAIIAIGEWARRRLDAWRAALAASDVIGNTDPRPESVATLPTVSNFAITPAAAGIRFVPRGGPDSIEATRFKSALRDAFERWHVSATAGRPPQRGSLDLARVAVDAVIAVDPTQTIPRRVAAGISLPTRIRAEIGAAFVEPMAYPVIDQPMYEPLKDRSADLFLPNINLIEMNSITLLETNQPFIEAYMVGLNHEFARELLWREYPTDQRGSTFRQFWDVSTFFNAGNLDDETLKERLRDIPPLHLWAPASKLGDHDNREIGGTSENELVLVIRGELLKRYPNAVIYAHLACWHRKDDGTAADQARHPCERSGEIDPSKERHLAPLTPAEEANPPLSKVRTPLYEARVDPDIHFFGFDLTVEVAKGGSGEQPTDEPGWFFVIKERPGEPRFGLDIDQQPHLNVWNDLSWTDVQPGPPGSHIEIASAPAAFTLQAPAGADAEKEEQYQDDRKVGWSHDMSSAELGYILFQAPVLVAVHAAEMLPR
jgi:hypothetical protein